MLESLQTVDQVENRQQIRVESPNQGDYHREPGPHGREPARGCEGGKRQRRRQIDPTTCERDYSADEIEFMQALDAYKRSSGRMFPTCSEILEVVRSLGYVRLSASGAPIPAKISNAAEGDAEEGESDADFGG